MTLLDEIKKLARESQEPEHRNLIMVSTVPDDAPKWLKAKVEREVKLCNAILFQSDVQEVIK